MSEPKIEIVDVPEVAVRRKYDAISGALRQADGKAVHICFDDFPRLAKTGGLYSSLHAKERFKGYILRTKKDGNGGRYLWLEKRA